MDQFIIISLLVKPIIAGPSLSSRMPHIRAQSHAQSLQVGWRGRVSLGVTSTRSLSLSLSLRAQFPQPLRSRVLGKLEGRKASSSPLCLYSFSLRHIFAKHIRERTQTRDAATRSDCRGGPRQHRGDRVNRAAASYCYLHVVVKACLASAEHECASRRRD